METFNTSKGEDKNSQNETNEYYKKLEVFDKDIEKRIKRKRILIGVFLVMMVLAIVAVIVISLKMPESSIENDNTDDNADDNDGDKYTFESIYYSNENETISLINPTFINKIHNMTIDGEFITPSSEYTFQSKGNHSVNIYIKQRKLVSLEYMFHRISKLRSIKFYPYIDTTIIADMRFMFSYCYSLRSIDFSNFNTEKVTDMRGMFYGCISLTSIDLSNFNTEKVTNMADMFNGCNHLRSIDLSNFNTEKVTDMTGMFYDCLALTSIDISNFITNDEEVILFKHLPEDGKIVINNKSTNKFKQIPLSWDIDFVN